MHGAGRSITVVADIHFSWSKSFTFIGVPDNPQQGPLEWKLQFLPEFRLHAKIRLLKTMRHIRAAKQAR